MASAEVVQGRLDHGGAEVGRIGRGVQFPEERDSQATCTGKLNATLSSASPALPYEASQVSLGSRSFVQRHQQLHHNICQVSVDQAVHALQTQVKRWSRRGLDGKI